MPITYDDEVKQPGIQIEYTPEQIKELLKCKNSFENFTKHMKIISLDQGEIPFSLYPFQKDMINMFIDYRFNIILSSRQSGKCLYFNTLVKIKNKETNIIEEKSLKELFDEL